MSSHYLRKRTGEDRTSLYGEVTNQTIGEVEAGRVPWFQPWGAAAGIRRDPDQGAHHYRVERVCEREAA